MAILHHVHKKTEKSADMIAEVSVLFTDLIFMKIFAL